MGRGFSFGFALAVMTIASPSFSDDTTVKAAKGPTTTETVIIHGRPARPNAAITVMRVPLAATARDLKQPLVERIAKSADKPPF
jgi:hypothetical protein